MKKKTIVGITLFVALTLITFNTLALAGPLEEGHPHSLFNGSAGMQRAFLKHHASLQMINTLIQLDISDTQKTEIADILKANRSAVKALHGSARNSFIHLIKEVTDHDYDEQAIREASQVFAQNMEECAVLKAQMMRQIRSVMNNGQMAILTAKRETMLNHIQTLKGRGLRQNFMQTLNLWINKHSSK
ncbi:MAG: hypothetical protein K8S27_00315 [Candidatus Omnitrophica bacterium]|nr:hypothetical protein [Candidatus Omnitrophota bacterium]